jgi:hypothetical protein
MSELPDLLRTSFSIRIVPLQHGRPKAAKRDSFRLPAGAVQGLVTGIFAGRDGFPTNTSAPYFWLQGYPKPDFVEF